MFADRKLLALKTYINTSVDDAVTDVVDTMDTYLLDKLGQEADGTGAYPASIANDSILAKLMAKGDPAAISSYNNTTDSLEAQADALAVVDGIADDIKANVLGAETSGTFSYLDTGGEQTVLEVTPLTTRRVIWSVWLDLVNMTQNGTIILYHKIDGTNYREFYRKSFTVATDADGIHIPGPIAVNSPWKITYTEGGDEAAARDIPYLIVYETKE